MPFGRHRRKERRRRRGNCVSCTTERSYEWFPVSLEDNGSVTVRLRTGQEKHISLPVVNQSATTICEHCLRENGTEKLQSSEAKSFTMQIDDLLCGDPEEVHRRMGPIRLDHEKLAIKEELLLIATTAEAERTLKWEKDEAKKAYEAGLEALSARLISELQDDDGDGEVSKRKLRNKRDREDDEEEKNTEKKQSTANKAMQKVYFNTIMQVNERQIQEDINLMYRSASRTPRPSHNRPSVDGVTEKDVDVVSDVMTYEKRKFERGNTVVLQSASSQHRYTAMIVNITSHEMTLKKLDGAKTRIPLSQLRSGRWTLFSKATN